MGKGSKPRPTNKDKYNVGWDRIFNDRVIVCTFCDTVKTDDNWNDEYDCCQECGKDLKEEFGDSIDETV